MTTYNDVQYIFDADFNNILDAFNTEGIISGLTTAQQSTPAMGVTVASGTVWVNGTKVTKGTSTNVVITAAHATMPRKDIILIDSSGTITAVAGTPQAANPQASTGVNTFRPSPPDITANKVLLAEVYIAPAVTTIVTANLTDRRILLGNSLLNEHATTAAGIHGVTGSVVGTTDSQVLTNKTLTTPTIGDFTNANHTHAAVGATGGLVDGANVVNTPAGNLSATTVQAAINELDTEKVDLSGDTMTGALVIDTTGDVPFKIVPVNDTATTTHAILVTNAAGDTDKFVVDNVGNIITVGTVDGVDVSVHNTATTGVHGVGTDYIAIAAGSQYTAVNKAGDTVTSTLTIDPATDVPALKIVPQNDTATTKFMIQGRNAANNADKFTVDNAGNIITVGNVDGTDISAHAHTGSDGTVVVNSANVTNTPAGNIAAITTQTAINELDTEKVAKAGDMMTSTLTIDPATDVNALKIIPPNDTATTTGSIVLRNSTDGADAFRIDNAGNIITVGTVDGVDVSAHVHSGVGQGGTITAGSITNVAAGNISSTNVQTAINELDTEKVARAGDTMTSTLIIDPATDVTALKIVPPNDTAATKFSIQARTAADGADAFSVDNAGNIVTVGNVDGVDISTHDHTGVAGHGVVITAGSVTNVAAGNIAAVTVQAAVNELDTEKVAKVGDTMTSTLVIDPATDVPAIKIIPATDTATTKFMIQGRNAADGVDKFTVDNAGNLVNVGTYHKVTITEPATSATLTITDGKTLTVADNASISGTNTGDNTTATVEVVTDTASATTWPALYEAATGSIAVHTDAGLTYNATTANLTTTTFTGALVGNATTSTNTTGNAATVTVADAGEDTTTYPLLGIDLTGNMSPRTDAGLSYQGTTNALTATTFVGALNGAASANVLKAGDTMTGALAMPIVTKAFADTGYTLTISDYTVLANAVGGAITLNLPTAVGITGRIYVIKKIDATVNAITIDASSSQTIDGDLTRLIYNQYEAVTIQSDGSNWQVI